MYKIVLMRHGESTWNRENRFTGWADINLTEKGEAQAREAGRLLKEAGFQFDLTYTSVLRRAIHTLWLTLEEMDLMWLPIVHSWRLNERHYGALQGLNKADTAAEYGEEQVMIWRRSYDIAPMPLDGLIKHLDDIGDGDIVKVNIPNAQPLVYELDADLKPIRNYYLGDAAAIEAAIKNIAQQGRTS